jgi:mono/diheme cytochrome c family protein
MLTRRRLILLCLLVVGGLLLAFWWQSANRGAPVVINGTAVPPIPALIPARVQQGAGLYAQHCAACHGTNLEGAPNWKQPDADGAYPPPPHDSSGHTWHHADDLLLSIVQNGGDPAFNSRMPAFKDKLSTEEILAILEFFKSRWGPEEREFQWWITSTSRSSWRNDLDTQKGSATGPTLFYDARALNTRL